MGAPLLIADISSHNTINSWQALLASVDGVIVKVSQNNDYAWPGAAAALAQARGKLSGAYHYAGPSPSVRRPPQAPTVEADFFLANYAHVPGERVVCDFEPTVPPADPDGWVHDWCQRVLDEIGVLPWVYMNSSLARSGSWARTRGLGCQLWVAQYGSNTGGLPSAAPSVGAWGSYVGWQYTSVGSQPGVAGALDLSQFFIDAATWRAPSTEGDDMQADERQWLSDIHTWVRGGDPNIDNMTLLWLQNQATQKQLVDVLADLRGGMPEGQNNFHWLGAQIGALTAAVQAVATTPGGLAAADITAAAKAGADQALAELADRLKPTP